MSSILKRLVPITITLEKPRSKAVSPKEVFEQPGKFLYEFKVDQIKPKKPK